MLPLQLVVGLVLGFSFARRTASLALVAAVGGLASVAWGVLIAVSVGDSGDSDRLSGFVGGTALAAINVLAGLLVGAVIAAAVDRGGQSRRST